MSSTRSLLPLLWRPEMIVSNSESDILSDLIEGLGRDVTFNSKSVLSSLLSIFENVLQYQLDVQVKIFISHLC
jgi:hypothetical protein